jgi:hypothetical protein
LAEFESDCGKMPDEPFEIIIFQIYDFWSLKIVYNGQWIKNGPINHFENKMTILSESNECCLIMLASS